jgi:uncharacterized phage protein gp47/JayE
MPGFLDFLPLFQESVDSIRARVNADANAGLSPTDLAFLDTSEGGFFYDLTGTCILEMARLWDSISTELPMAVFPAFSWGIYLDEHGVTVNLPRTPASAASGVVSFLGDPDTNIPAGTQVSTVQIDANTPPQIYSVIDGGTIPSGGTLDLNVLATVMGSAGNVPAGTVTVLASPVSGGVIASVTNNAPMSAGADVEDDESYRERILRAYAGSHGAGTVNDYEQWALDYPGIGFVTVRPLWAGPGTVKVIITDDANNPVNVTVTAGLQNVLDPVPAEGRGLAPIGATVTVTTPSLVAVNVAATIIPEPGFSLSGAGGTIAVGTDVFTTIDDYVSGLPPSDDVILTSVIAAIMSVNGVLDTTGVTLNGVAANFTIGDDEVASSGVITLT